MDKEKNNHIEEIEIAMNSSNIENEAMEESYKKRSKKREAKNKKINIVKIILIIIFLFLAVFFGYKAFFEIRKNQTTAKDNIYYTPAAQTTSGQFKNFFVTTTIDGIKIINQNGEDVLNDVNMAVSPYVKGMNEPVFLTNNKTMLIYDISGKTAVLFGENGVIKTLNFPNEIIKAKMSASGQFVVILKTEGSKAAVKVYNQDGNELMTWYSGTGYVADAQISDTKSAMAVVTNEVSNSKISSKILFFTFDNPEPYMGKILGESIAAYVSFYDDFAYVLCDDCLYFIDSEGELSKPLSFGKDRMKFFKSFKNGNLMICKAASEPEKYEVCVFNSKGKQISSFLMDSFLSVCDISDKEFLVLKRRGVLSVSDHGKTIRDISFEFDVKNASYYKDKIAVLSQDAIYIY